MLFCESHYPVFVIDSFFVFPSLFCEMCVCFWGGSITAWQLSQVEFWQKLALSKHSAGRRRDEEDFTFVKNISTSTPFEDLVYLWQGMGLCRRSPFELGRLHSGSPEGEGRGFGGRAVENLLLIGWKWSWQWSESESDERKWFSPWLSLDIVGGGRGLRRSKVTFKENDARSPTYSKTENTCHIHWYEDNCDDVVSNVYMIIIMIIYTIIYIQSYLWQPDTISLPLAVAQAPLPAE